MNIIIGKNTTYNHEEDLYPLLNQFFHKLELIGILTKEQRSFYFNSIKTGVNWDSLNTDINSKKEVGKESKKLLNEHIKLLIKLLKIDSKQDLDECLGNHLSETKHPFHKLYLSTHTVQVDFIPDKFLLFYHCLDKVGDSLNSGDKLVVHYLEDKEVCLKSAEAACEHYYKMTDKKITIELERLHVKGNKLTTNIESYKNKQGEEVHILKAKPYDKAEKKLV